MKVIILGSGQMLMNLIAGCEDAGVQIVGVLRYERVHRPFLDRVLLDIFYPSKEFNYIKGHKLYEIKARSANSAEFKKEILRLNADIVLVGTWGEKIKKPIINLPRLAMINVHPALLPKYRGPNPYLQSIKHLEKESGVTFHLMDENFDTGPILLQKHVPIEVTDTGAELRDKTATAARVGVRELLINLDTEIIIPIDQDEKYASYFPQISEDEIMLDFSKSAEELSAQIRGFHPWYKCYFEHNRQFFKPNPYKLKIFDDAEDGTMEEAPLTPALSRKGRGGSTRKPITAGTIVEKSHSDKSITVLCGDGKLLKMDDVKLYGFSNRFFTKFYIRYFVSKLK